MSQHSDYIGTTHGTDFNQINKRLRKIFNDLDCTYFIIGNEICPTTDSPHGQWFCQLPKKMALSKFRKILKPDHIQPRNGTTEEASKYCKKGEQPKLDWNTQKWHGTSYGLNASFIEKGTIRKFNPGARNDLKLLTEQIFSGEITTDDIMVSDPFMYHQYGRTLERVENNYIRTQKRTWMTTCQWLYGPTGVGKSHVAYTHYTDHYDYPYDGDWMDGYRNQPVLILNDFRGQIKYDTLLRWIDKWPAACRQRNKEPRPFLFKHIVITSCKTPQEVYHNRDSEDSIEQLLRRVEITKIEKRGQKIQKILV